MELLLILLVALCQILALVIATANKPNGVYNKLDYALAFVSIVGFGAALYLTFTSKEKQDEKDLLEIRYQQTLSKELHTRDSLHRITDSTMVRENQKQVDSAYGKSITASNEALAKYNLILIDSMNTVSKKVNYKAIGDPQLALVGSDASGSPIYYSLLNGDSLINFKVISVNNIAYDFSIAYCIFGEYQGNGNKYLRFLNSETLTQNVKFLVPSNVITLNQVINKSITYPEEGLIAVKFDYFTDENHTTKKSLIQHYIFDFKKGRSEGMSNDFKQTQDLEKLLIRDKLWPTW